MKEIIDKVLPVIFPLIYLVVFFVFIYFNKEKKEALRKLSSFLNGAVSKSIFTSAFNGEYQGYKFSVALIPASRNTPAYLNISLFKTSFFKVSIYKESILSNLGKKIGVIHEVKINDENFDKEFFVFSNKPNEAMFYINNISIKDAIRGLFNAGFKSISINGKLVLIRKPNYTLEEDLQSQSIINILQKLISMARALS